MPNHLAVLIAEDHPVNQKVMGLLLESLGVRYHTVKTGLEAVEAATSSNYGLILMDCSMPRMGGFDASFRIRKFEFNRTRHTPIIACTILDKENIIDQCIRSGMDDYIGKPIDRDNLSNKIACWSLIPMTLHPISSALKAQIKLLEGPRLRPPLDRNYLDVLYGIQQLDDILELYLNITESLLGQLKSAIVHGEVDIVGRMTHELKCSSVAVSANEMAALCRELELAGEVQNWPEAERLYASLGLAFARVKQYLNSKEELVKKMQTA